MMPAFTIFIQYSTKSPSQSSWAIGQEKEMELIIIGKEAERLSVFTDDMIL